MNSPPPPHQQPDPSEPQQDDLADAQLDLTEVFDLAHEDGLPEPSQLAFENAGRLLQAMYQLAPRRFEVYPAANGHIAIDGRGEHGRTVALMCGSAGDAVCLVTIDGESRRAHYDTTRGLPDDFMRQALRELESGLPE